jgi:tRNA modification GTPase
MTESNISAISTAAGVGGVAIIRISGISPLKIAEKMFKPNKNICISDFEPYKLYTGEIDGGTFKDYGMCVYFKAPKSFTGEDMVEFHCHGGMAITQGILNRTFELGCNAADKGEFTKRAFLNGKLSLSSAEGLIDMINSESEAQVRAGYNLYREKLKNKTVSIQSVLTEVLAEIDADIDFPEDDIEPYKLSAIKYKIEECLKETDILISGYKTGSRIKNGVSVVIVGRPNTGKSSVLNALAGYDKALVSDIAGTTRDVVESTIIVDGVKFNLFDTAGIRENSDYIEGLGIERSKKMIENADLVILVLDASETLNKEDFLIKQAVEQKNKIIVFNKTDLKQTIQTGGIDLLISAKSGLNIDNLKKLIYTKTIGKIDTGAQLLIEERHYRAFLKAKEHLDDAKNNVNNIPLDILSVDIKAAWDYLGEISGLTASEEIINEIFSKFCVGK